MKLFKTNMQFVLVSLLALISGQALAADFVVSPMLIEIESEAPTAQPFSFAITGKGESAVKLSIFEMKQLESGYMSFSAADRSDAESIANWIELEDDSFRIRDGETRVVNGQITVPRRAAGTNLIGIMVEEDSPEEAQNGITVKVRYAVVINMRMSGFTNRGVRTSFEDLVVSQKDDGTYVEGMFTNDSKIDEWLGSQAQIRDENNRLMARVDMRTDSAWQRNDTDSRVFPAAKVRVFGKLEEKIQPGEYKVIVRNRFAGRTQPAYRDIVRIEERIEDENMGEGEDEGQESGLNADVSPAALPIEIRSNGTSFSSFVITNNGDKEISVDLPTELQGLEEKGVSEFKFFPPSVLIKPGRSSRIVLQQTHLSESAYEGITFEASVTTNDASADQDKLNIVTIAGS